jgi:hypothetical protein
MYQKILFQKLLPLLTLLLFVQFQYAQKTITVRGFVYDEQTGETVPFAKILLTPESGGEDGILGATTDIDGFFNFSAVPIGRYAVLVRNPEYDDYETEMSFGQREIESLRFTLTKKSDVLEVEEVSVFGEDQKKRTSVEMSVNKLDKKGLERLPSFGAENDVVSAFSVTPGVVTTGDQGGQIYVRGGTPIQNLIRLDGMTIYNPFHSIGFFSVFETELIKSAEIFTGGYSAQYGGRISSVMDITYRDGNFKEFGGKASISPFMGKLVLEGPMFKANEDGSGVAGSYIFSGKHALLDQTSPILYPYANDGEGMPFNFTDVYAKATIRTEEGSKFSAFAFSNNDAVNFPEIAELYWNSYGGGVNFTVLPSSSKVILRGRINASSYQINFIEDVGMQPRTSEIAGFDMGFDFSYYLPNDGEITYGVNFGGFNTDFRTFNQVNRLIQRQNYNFETSFYVDYKYVKNRWVFNPGTRVQYYPNIPDLIVEPRLGAKYNITEKWRWKVAGGRYSQNFTAAASDQDVVTLFFGFLSAPTDVQANFTKPNGEIINPENGLQLSWHGITGFEYDLTKHLSLNIEGYYKYFPQLSNINLRKLYDDVAEFANIPDEFKKDFIIESGFSYGLDFLLKYSKTRLFLWGVYSYGISERWDGFDWYPPIFDRRHNVNLVGNYLFGKKKDLELSVRWNFGSGLPFTPTVGFFQGETLPEGINTDITTTNPNEVSFILGDFNSARLPTYHRLDITVKKRFEFKNKTQMETTFGVTNVYNRDNIFYVNRVTNDIIYQLPILPSIGVSYTF